MGKTHRTSGIDKKYTIQHDSEVVFSAGRTAGGEQVLIGTHYNYSVVAVFFDQTGQLLRNEHRTVSRQDAKEGNGQEALLIQTAWKLKDDWQKELGFATQTIQVQRFFLSYEGIGIQDLPDFMRQYLEDAPDENDELFRPELYEDIENFIRAEQFVFFWCGKDFWINREGEVTDT